MSIVDCGRDVPFASQMMTHVSSRRHRRGRLLRHRCKIPSAASNGSSNTGAVRSKPSAITTGAAHKPIYVVHRMGLLFRRRQNGDVLAGAW